MNRITALCSIALLAASASATEREVQIRSIDFESQTIELFNFADTDQSLSGWRFCSHDFDQSRRYTAANGLNGVTIQGGTSVFIHFNNDAPGGDPDRINRTALGGAFALPLDQDAYGLQIYAPIGGPISFGNGARIADHLQWNIGGQGAGMSEFRSSLAVGENLWTAIGDFISTEADSTRITLTDLSGDEAGAPAEYEVTDNAMDTCPTDLTEDGETDISDLLQLLTVFNSTSSDGDVTGDGETDISDLLQLLTVFNTSCP